MFVETKGENVGELLWYIGNTLTSGRAVVILKTRT